MSSFAFYRFPHEESYTRVVLTEGEPEELLSPEELNGRSGFVFAPFAPSAECPILLFPKDGPTPGPPERREEERRLLTSQGRESYAKEFSRFHKVLSEGKFSKLVLARSEEIRTGALSPEELFEKACQLYPRMFVALVSTARSGTWLMATPEVLLRSEAEKERRYRTMALAGTMRLEGSLLDFDNPSQELVQQIRWSQKNIQEQRYVASYIKECLKDFSDDVVEDGPYTTRAANLVHLRSDFRFTLHQEKGIGSLLSVLHPTPAVCGIPKQAAQAFILENEDAPRRYYSGFCGPLSSHSSGTALYVSLRCMEIATDSCRLYAGGGLLRDSIEQQEWEETEAKMQTMRSLIP